MVPKPWKKGRGGEGGSRSPRPLHLEPVVDELDLHGHTADEAEHRLAMFLDRVGVTARGEVVRVITGRGTGSAGPPVLQGVVRDALNGWLADRIEDWAVDIGAGAYLVRVRR